MNAHSAGVAEKEFLINSFPILWGVTMGLREPAGDNTGRAP